jgi:hypothetical protein
MVRKPRTTVTMSKTEALKPWKRMTLVTRVAKVKRTSANAV